MVKHRNGSPLSLLPFPLVDDRTGSKDDEQHGEDADFDRRHAADLSGNGSATASAARIGDRPDDVEARR